MQRLRDGKLESTLLKLDKNKGKYYLAIDKVSPWMEGLLQKAMTKILKEDLRKYGIDSVSWVWYIMHLFMGWIASTLFMHVHSCIPFIPVTDYFSYGVFLLGCCLFSLHSILVHFSLSLDIVIVLMPDEKTDEKAQDPQETIKKVLSKRPKLDRSEKVSRRWRFVGPKVPSQRQESAKEPPKGMVDVHAVFFPEIYSTNSRVLLQSMLILLPLLLR